MAPQSDRLWQGLRRGSGEQLESKRGREVPGKQGMRSKGPACSSLLYFSCKTSTAGVGTGFLCHLDKGRPMAQGPRDEAGGWDQTAEAEA